MRILNNSLYFHSTFWSTYIDGFTFPATMFISMHSQVPKRILGLGGDIVSHAQTHEEGLFPDQIILVPLSPSPSSLKKRGLISLIGKLERNGPTGLSALLSAQNDHPLRGPLVGFFLPCWDLCGKDLSCIRPGLSLQGCPTHGPRATCGQGWL